jgi:hypothetical protein
LPRRTAETKNCGKSSSDFGLSLGTVGRSVASINPHA